VVIFTSSARSQSSNVNLEEEIKMLTSQIHEIARSIAELEAKIESRLECSTGAKVIKNVTPVESEAIGLNIDFEIASVYVLRGNNVFQEKSQSDQNGLFAPSITYTLGETGIYFTYWAGYQTTGHNMAELVDIGLGHEQDLIVGFDYELVSDVLTLNTAFIYYLYPFANKEKAGASLPSFLEPSLGISYSAGLDLSLQLAYLLAVQEALSDFRYLYFHPTIGKRFEFSPTFGMSLSLGIGYKLFHDPDKMKDNVWDIGFDLEVPIQVTKAFYLTPAVHFAWTNLEGVGPGEEYVVWFGISTGANM
jgi:hypothetical protein